MRKALILVSLLGMVAGGCTATLFKKDATLGIVETLAKAQATPTPQVVPCKVTYEDGTEKAAVCPAPEVKK